MVDLTSRIIGAESGGNAYARNPRSSAGGAGQFIDATWLATLRKHRPDLASGRSDSELLRLKFDPALSQEMTQAYAGENQGFLRQRGIDPNEGNTYLAHFAGPAGAAALHANPHAAVEATLGPRVVAANPFLRGKTGADVINWAAGKMDPAKAMAARLRQKFGTSTEGGVTASAGAPALAGGEGMDRLKSALGKSYDPSALSTADQMLAGGAETAKGAKNWIDVLNSALQTGLGTYEKYAGEGSKKKEYDAAQRDGLANATDATGVARLLMASPDPDTQMKGAAMFAQAQKDAKDKQASFSKTPVIARGKDGNLVALQFNDRGEAVQVPLPQGVELSDKILQIDDGTGTQLYGANAQRPVERIAKDLAGAEEAKKRGEQVGIAKQNLPAVESRTERVLDRLARLETDPMRESFTGYRGYLPNMSPEANSYQGLLDEVAGNTFLAGFSDLRGSGAITEAEGLKAQQALSRLQTIAPSDPGFASALTDARAVFEEIRQNARMRAGQDTAPASAATAPAPDAGAGDFKVLRVR